MHTPSQKAEVVWHTGHVSQKEREQLLKQNACTLWLTGLSASGKSTLAFALERELFEHGFACYVLDGDNVRHGLNRGLGFSQGDRTENIRRIAEVAKLMNDAGLIVISAFISPYKDDRKLAKDIIGANRFLEIYVNTPLEVCEARDPKGMYKRARAGQTTNFTGIDAPYEAPENPDLLIDTSKTSLADSVAFLLAELGVRFKHS